MHHSFRASVLATLRQRNWAGGMFSTAKSIPSAAGSSTTTFPMWTDMKTSRQLILGNMKDKSKYSRVDSPAKDSLLLASERERRMTATYGRRCIEQSPKSSPLMFLARTLLESSQWYHPTMSLRWRAKPLYSMRVRRFLRAGQPTSPRTSEETLSEKDMPSKYFYYQLVPSVRPTAETECGFSQSGLAETQKKRGGGFGEVNVQHPSHTDRIGIPAPQASGGTEGEGGQLHLPANQRSIEAERPRRLPSVHPTDTNLKRLEGSGGVRVQEAEGREDGHPCLLPPRSVPLPASRWEGFPTVEPTICRGDDGLPKELDFDSISFSRWRAESLKAYGNSMVMPLVKEIFIAIEKDIENDKRQESWT